VIQRTPNSTRQQSEAQQGVKKPRHNSAAGTIKKIRVHHDVTRVQFAVPSTKNAVATEMRNNNSPVPAIPAGNMENNRCTVKRLSGSRPLGNPKRDERTTILSAELTVVPLGTARQASF
jgi:hypothetical protein